MKKGEQRGLLPLLAVALVGRPYLAAGAISLMPR